MFDSKDLELSISHSRKKGGIMEEELIEVRKAKLKQLRKRGIDPYGARFRVNITVSQIFERFEELIQSGEEVKLAGRIISIRRHGKACFSHLKANGQRIQVYVRRDEVGDERYDLFTHFDIGDIIGVGGRVFQTRTGEITILVRDFTFLSKSLRPLPEKWHGLRDIETRYRERHIDLIVNEHTRDVFVKRSKIIQEIRNFLSTRGFLEVETPMIQPCAGGALARPFTTYHNVMHQELFLRIAPELYLKRLVVGGFDKIFELNKSFRNEGVSVRHNPEFTMLEVYEAYSDYQGMMDLAEEMIVDVTQKVFGSLKLEYQGQKIDLTPPWERMSVLDAIRRFVGIELHDLGALAREIDRMGLDLEGVDEEGGDVLDKCLDKFVEKKLVHPTFLIDFPTRLSPLAKRKREDPELVERFELFIGGEEIANAYSELNDPEDQEKRFLDQGENRIDYDYIRALEYGLPPTGGLGIGIDRLVMVLTDSSSIRDVLFFPQLKRRESFKRG
jgi:lysyl-tRNA synthetase class 2